MDIIELSDTCRNLMGAFLTDTMSMETEYIFTPDFVVHNFDRFIKLTEQEQGTTFDLSLSYKTFVEDDKEYGCILFQHVSGLKCLSDPLFQNSRYMRKNAYMVKPYCKFRRMELEKFMIENKKYIGLDAKEFAEYFRQYLFGIGKLFKVTVDGDSIVVDNTYKRKIFENGKVKSFITVGDNFLEEAHII